MVFLRARWYDVRDGRFLSQDPWPGSIYQPSSLHKFLYVSANPINRVDPSGLVEEGEADNAREIIHKLDPYSVIIREDFGWQRAPIPPHIAGLRNVVGETTWICTGWQVGLWSIGELEIVLEAVQDLARAMGGENRFRAKLGGVEVKQKRMEAGGLGGAHSITLNEAGFTKWPVVHELSHAWDGANSWRLSRDMQRAMGAGFAHPIQHSLDPKNPAYWYDPGRGPPPCGVDKNFDRREDFAEAVAAFVYPDLAQQNASDRGWPYVDPARGHDYADFSTTPRGRYIGALLIAPP